MRSNRNITLSIGFFIAFFVFSPCIIQGQPFSSEVKVNDIRLFKAGRDVPPKGQRVYTARFPKSTTQIVYCQVEFINPLYSVEKHTYSLDWEYFHPDGSLFKEVHADFEVKSSTYIASYVKGVGWVEPGKWSLGTYNLRVYIDGKLVGQKEFTVYENVLSESISDVRESEASLYNAAYEGNYASVKALLEEGSDPNVKHKYGGYPLIIAILRDHADIVELLLDYGANIYVKDARGMSAAMLSRFKQNSQIIRLLKNAEDASIKGVWEGKWTSPTGYLYGFVMDLKLSFKNRVEGTIDWTLKYSPQSSEKLKVGLKAKEFVKGIYDSDTRVVSLAGQDEDDPYGIIDLKSYRLIISSDGRSVNGKTSGGTGESRFSASRR